MTPSSLSAYAAGRDALLGSVVDALSGDDRFAAAWLTGSFGRGEQDEVSDLDLSLLTTEAGATLLEDVALRGGTSEARRQLFEMVGAAGVIHENPYNVPPGGSFSVVMYPDGPYCLDWTLLPPGHPGRPHDSELLFAHRDIPMLQAAAPLQGDKLRARLSERWAFFWMMALVAAKYWVREDEVLVVVTLDQLHRILGEMRCLLVGELPRHRAASGMSLTRTREEQAAALEHACTAVDALFPQLTALGTSPLVSGRSAVDALLRLSEARHS